MPAMQPMAIVCLQVNFASSLLPSKARLPSALPRFAVHDPFLPTSTSVFLRIPLCSFPTSSPRHLNTYATTEPQDRPASFHLTEINQDEIRNHARRWRIRLRCFCPDDGASSLWCMLQLSFPVAFSPPRTFLPIGTSSLDVQSHLLCKSLLESLFNADSPPVVPLLQQHARKGWGA
jgi:hypothetical protein